MNRAVFLDRDNTLIHNDGDLGDPAEVKLMQAAAMAVASLRGLGYKIVVVTNQGGVARGKYSEADVDAVHERLSELLQQHANGAVVDRFYYCPFHPEGSVPRYRKEHPWRKPQPGMMLQAAEDLKLDLTLCWMVGDAPRDIEAGKAAGTRTVLIGSAAADTSTLDEKQQPDFTAGNLIEAARIIAQQIRPDSGRPTAGEPTAPSAPSGAAPSTGPPAPPSAGDVPITPAPPRPGATYPAVHKLGTTVSSKTVRGETPRPFKPWDIQPRSQSDEAEGEPARSTQRMTGRATAPPTERDAKRQAEPDCPSEAMQEEGQALRQATAEVGTREAAPVEKRGAAPAGEPGPPPVEKRQATPVQDDEAAPLETGSVQTTLNQILRELRQRHVQDADWSPMKVAALGFVQPFAAFCALMAVLNVDASSSLLGWLGGAIMGQLVVLTLLIVHWQR